MITQLTNLSRINKQLILWLLDSCLLVLILLAAFSIRLGYWYFPEGDFVWAIFAAPVIAIPIFTYFDLYRTVIRYMGFKALWIVTQAVSLYALIWGVVGFMAAIEGIPRSVVLINWVLALLVIGGLRVMARWLLIKDGLKAAVESYEGKRVLIYGAGDAGIQLVSALEHAKEYRPMGLIDDSKDLQGSQIKGISVYAIQDIANVIDKLRINEILIAIPSASRAKRATIINKLEPYPVLVRILPGVTELAGGKISIEDLREVSIKDLLGRDTVKPNKDLLSQNISNKVVLVTGAGGSIGAEICRQVLSLKPKTLVLYEMNELALYTIEKELGQVATAVYPILGSVNNKARLDNVLQGFGVDTVYHSAAYKHVPMVEFNNSEGVNNNVFGTWCAARAAMDANVETFVLISTDKAVRPTSTMGTTKRIAELVLQGLSAEQNNIKFTMVRFGNVLGSSGSVIPLFKQQIKDGGPVTVTDKDIIRYFMTIPEAVELVIQAGAMGMGGDVFVLDMGEPVRIDDLAKKMIRLSGLEVRDKDNPEGDIEIKYTGLRPGEKLYEELLIGDNVSDTNNPLIMRAEEESLPWPELESILGDMQIAINNCDQKRLRDLLIQAVPGFKPQCEISDLMHQESL